MFNKETTIKSNTKLSMAVDNNKLFKKSCNYRDSIDNPSTKIKLPSINLNARQKVEKKLFIKTIKISFLEENEKHLTVKPAVSIVISSLANDKKPLRQILSDLKATHKRPKKLSYFDLIKIKIDKKRAHEVKKMYFQSSSMSFVPYLHTR